MTYRGSRSTQEWREPEQTGPGCVGGCTYLGRHVTDCEDDDCRGCLPRPGEPYWCDRCISRLGERIARLPGLAHDVAARRDGRLAPTGRAERAGSSPDPASQSPAYDGFDEVTQWTCQWEEVFRRLLKHSPPEQPSWTAGRGKALSLAAFYLWQHRRAVLAADAWQDDEGEWTGASVEFPDELVDLTRRMERGAGVDRLTHHLPLPCLRCDRLALTREDGSDTVECRACGERWTQDDYDRLANAYGYVVRMDRRHPAPDPLT